MGVRGKLVRPPRRFGVAILLGSVLFYDPAIVRSRYAETLIECLSQASLCAKQCRFVLGTEELRQSE